MNGYANGSGATEQLNEVESYSDDEHSAEVMVSYRVWANAAADANEFRETPHFATAFRWMRWEPNASMRVSFRWRAGDREGDGHATYKAEWHPTAPAHLVESTVRNLISRAIGEALANGRYILADPEDVDEARAAQEAKKRRRSSAKNGNGGGFGLYNG